MRPNRRPNLSVRALVPWVLAVALFVVPSAAKGQSLHLITKERMEANLRILASDAFEGRRPGTHGGRATTAFLAAVAEAEGLRPGNRGSFLQPISIRHSQVIGHASSLTISRADESDRLRLWEDYFFSAPTTRLNHLAAGVPVFANHGIVAPELGVDDYRTLDVRGKIVVALADSPAEFAPDARAHYSDSRRKEQLALDRGAAGMIHVITTAMEQRTPFSLLRSHALGGGMEWLSAEGEPDRATDLPVAWVRQEALANLFSDMEASQDPPSDPARTGDIVSRPVIEMVLSAEHREFTSHNVVAVIPGTDPSLRDEFVVYSAHWDHEGVGSPVDGDSIYNGALDNASGTAELMEIARAYALGERPRRSVAFVWVTAEERGLLGSDYFARHPTLNGRMVANINLDTSQLFQPATDAFALGELHSTLGRDFRQAAAALGLTVRPDPNPAAVGFIRSDQYSFVQQGVPALFVNLGFSPAGGGPNALEAYRSFAANHYHRPSDQVDLPFDFEAGRQVAALAYLTGWIAANADRPPAWDPTSFYGTRFVRPEPPGR